MMWGIALILLCYIQAQVMSSEIKVECHEYNQLPQSKDTSPSLLADLKVEQVTVEGHVMLNISWAVSIDASLQHLKGTQIKIAGESSHFCEYKPHLADADLRGSKQKWFHYLLHASSGEILIQAANLPLPPLGSGPAYKLVTKVISPPPQPSVTPKSTQASTVFKASTSTIVTTASPMRTEFVTLTIIGGLTCVLILISCYIIYKTCGTSITTSFGFKKLPQPYTVPVHVLLVYPAENSSFQQAVVALAEFLQWHGGCNVAIDMWKQGKIAELGPMRWLAEQVKAADQVLIICPQSSSRPNHSTTNGSFPEPAVPAAAFDLYPLILNMVGSHAKSTSNLAKFWVVQLSDQKNKRSSNLALELRSCKSFCLMKDLNKLCRNLHSHRQNDKKISDLILKTQISYSEKSTMKLREAVEKHLQSDGTTEKCDQLCLNICNDIV